MSTKDTKAEWEAVLVPVILDFLHSKLPPKLQKGTERCLTLLVEGLWLAQLSLAITTIGFLVPLTRWVTQALERLEVLDLQLRVILPALEALMASHTVLARLDKCLRSFPRPLRDPLLDGNDMASILAW